jgi:hypothetical protein
MFGILLSVPKTPSIGFSIASESEHDCWMFAIAFLFVRVLCDCFKSRRRLEVEVLVPTASTQRAAATRATSAIFNLD